MLYHNKPPRYPCQYGSRLFFILCTKTGNVKKTKTAPRKTMQGAGGRRNAGPDRFMLPVRSRCFLTILPNFILYFCLQLRHRLLVHPVRTGITVEIRRLQ